MQRIVSAALAAGIAISLAAAASAAASTALAPRALSQAQKIKADVTARYSRAGGPRLAVTEASPTSVVEAYVLLSPRLDEARIVPADNGIFYAICPQRATCPYPAPRLARSPAALVPRRLALELALRTFVETSADLVAVSLPTPEFVFFAVEREELEREVDLASLATALSGDPSRIPTASVRDAVERITRPRLYVPLGLEPMPGGREALGAMPLWPEVDLPRGPLVRTSAEHFGPAAARSAGAGVAAGRGSTAIPFELHVAGSPELAAPGGAFSLGHPREGSFDATAPFCPAGELSELEQRLLDGWFTRLRRFACADGSGSFTARTWLTSLDEELGLEAGAWQILAGTGRFVELRGMGTYLSVRDDDATEDGGPSVDEAWWGRVDFDAVAPTLEVSRASASPLGGSRRDYLVRVELSTRDDVSGAPVSFLVAASGRVLLAARTGTTSSGSASVVLRVRPGDGVRTLRLRVEVWDAVGNIARAVHRLTLPH